MKERTPPPPARRPLRLLTYPNALTLLRFPLAAAFLLVDHTTARGVIILAGGLSDWLDGWLSRRLEQTSGFGELVDPIADKTFILTVLMTYWIGGRIAAWELGALLARDIYNVLAFAVVRALGLPVRFRSRPSGKLVTWFQVVTALALLLSPPSGHALVLATGLAGIVAIVDYTASGVRGLRPGSGAL